MKDEDMVVESFGKAMKALIARLPPEEVLSAYAPEQRMAGLAPEQRLAGLPEAQAVLALPDAALRGLSNEYLATLPRETRAAIQLRLAAPARPAASPRAPARPRKSRGRSG
jgi:hypothetical protein